ncbi:Ino2p Ecym_4290 [Eremothecium cymbalariae DBVPG|uniref:INO2 bHLH domain-containing protein n=1 Tax=Eremothecium cymbalariae (strain CBS 270.75 / DBVPG 7215 / KCTC 17166 / NRRL Y-17582) TaxID=931890 RepID=G8JTK0_ERECY|nr:hypothetical protein Ecym_4290 [Eremothecium cymbalariae DBVPG\
MSMKGREKEGYREGSYFDELFDLDLDIDFETAYNMISGTVEQLDCVEGGSGGETHGSVNDGSQFVTRDDLTVGVGRFEVGEGDGKVSGGGLGAGNNGGRSGLLPHNLLSVDESYAIENFLDSLLPSNEGSPLPNVSIHPSSNMMAGPGMVTGAGSLSLPPPPVPIPASSSSHQQRQPQKQQQQSQQSHLHKHMIDDGRYCPQVVELPEIKLPEDEIPDDINLNRAKLRRWKHVYCEKQRRMIFKQAFDELIAMVRFPRPSESQVAKVRGRTTLSREDDISKVREPGDGKRIPKHVLLKYIVQDIELLVLANQELESLMTTSTRT